MTELSSEPLVTPAPPKTNPQLAGLVLAALGILTYGATSPYGLILSVEWLRDTNRDWMLRKFDWLGVILGVPGTLYFMNFSYTMGNYAPGGQSFGTLIWLNWAGVFLTMLLRRKRLLGPIPLD